MRYTYDRRTVMASKVMSPWIWRLFDKIAQAHKSKIEGVAEDYGKDLSNAEELVRKHPTASDEELVKLALTGFAFSWTDIIEDRESTAIIRKWVQHVMSQTSANPDEDVDVEVRGDALVVKTRAWGTTFEYDSEDPWARVEVPPIDDMLNREISAKFKLTGAEVDSEWKLVDDPNGYEADALVFPTTLKWSISDDMLSQKYGAAAFEKTFKAALPEARKEVEANPRTHTPAPAPGRKRR